MRQTVGLVTGATYNQATCALSEGREAMIMSMTWPVVTGFLNDSTDTDRYNYLYYDDVSDEDFLQLDNAKVILFTAYTGHVYRILELARSMRISFSGDKKFIIGGIHVTAIVKETIRAYLYQVLGKNNSLKIPKGKFPLETVIQHATKFISAEAMAELSSKPMETLQKFADEDPDLTFLENELIPGKWYFDEFQQLYEVFDVVFAGLLDGDPASSFDTRKALLDEIDNPSQVFHRSLISLGFGDINRFGQPNFRLYTEKGRPDHLWESMTSYFETKRRLPLALYETGRGCQFTCDFCSVVNFFGGLQYKNSDKIFNDITVAIEEFGMYEFSLSTITLMAT